MYNKRWFANLSLLAIALVWGATFTLTKDALATVSVFAFLTVRFIVATVVLTAIALAYRPSRVAFRHGGTWILGIALGLMLFLAYAFQTLGLGRTGAAVSGFITGLYVVLVPLLSIPLFRRFPRLRIWVGVIMATVGLAFLSGRQLLGMQPGDLLVLGCTVFLALQILFIEKYGTSMDSLALASIELAVVALGSLVCAVAVHNGGASEMMHPAVWLSAPVFWAVVVNGILGTALAYWAQNVFQRYTSSAQIALIFSMEPVSGAIIAWMALHERLTVFGWAGGLLIFVSMIVADPTVTWISVRRLLRLREV